MASAEQLTNVGVLRGHKDWVTQIATTQQVPDMILSSSRDKSIIVWNLSREDGNFGVPKRRLTGHSHFVSDVVISSDGQFALSGSWDHTLRLWDLQRGVTTRRFVGHTKDVMSVAFSADNRQIVSASRDRSIKLWNTLGVCKYTISVRNKFVRVYFSFKGCLDFQFLILLQFHNCSPKNLVNLL